ncbi:MAG: DUF1016 domain-containing protein [Gammaproteobacteria bacterium]|nr:MAG: DUF1016 domain-containing protein [Gammaproteobacteria bacterium]
MKIIQKSFEATNEYNNFLEKIKADITKARNKALMSVNTELINLYFSIGKNISLKQRDANWGDDFIGQIEKDIKRDMPDVKGFSRTNLFYMKKCYSFFQENKKIPQVVGQIPWGHIRLILDKIQDNTEAFFYINKTIENSWSRTILDHQISLNLYSRDGKLLSNFKNTLSNREEGIVQKSFKKNYILDFLNLSEKAKEKDLEKLLTQDICSFLMEMGTGFAFVGKQYKLNVGDKEFFIDLLFYNYILKRFVIIELKTTEFKPKHIGQLGFYMSAVNKTIKTKDDKETIGLIICKSKNETIVEYALDNSNQPTGVAEYKFLNQLPKDMQKTLPTTEEIKNLFDKK